MSEDPFTDLAQSLPDDFSKTLLAGAVESLHSTNPLRAHHFAGSLRELVGHVLQLLAPDNSVTATSWFEPEADRPTRRQRARFAVQGGMPDAVVDSLGVDLEGMQKELRDAVDDLNKYTHVREDTLLQGEAEIATFANKAGDAVLSFFQTIKELRTVVAGDALHHLGKDVFEKFIESSVDDLDILSGHTQVDGIEVENVEIVEIGLQSIQYAVEGTVYVQLVWGSGSDHERGDGASRSDSFPFSCMVEGSVESIKDFSAVSNIEVDTSSWFSNGDEEETH